MDPEANGVRIVRHWPPALTEANGRVDALSVSETDLTSPGCGPIGLGESLVQATTAKAEDSINVNGRNTRPRADEARQALQFIYLFLKSVGGLTGMTRDPSAAARSLRALRRRLSPGLPLSLSPTRRGGGDPAGPISSSANLRKSGQDIHPRSDILAHRIDSMANGNMLYYRVLQIFNH
jgi:hypothetical protein